MDYLCKIMLREIVKKVLLLSQIPEEFRKDVKENFKNWLPGELVEVHVDDPENDGAGKWIVDTYPELKDEVSFFIEID